MEPTEILIDDVVVKNRQRIDHSNTDGLKESLAERGTIQPIVLAKQPDNTLRLVGGGRRLLFLKELGHTKLYHGSTYNPQKPGFVFGHEIPDDVLHELELEENIKRKPMTWQEHCLNVAEIHRLKLHRSALEGSRWGQKETGGLLGCSAANINYLLEISRKLKAELDLPLEQRRYWQRDNLTEAWRLRMRDEEEALEKSLSEDIAAKSRQNLPTTNLPTDTVILPSITEEAIPLAEFDSIPESDPKRERLLELRQRDYFSLSWDEAKELYLGNPLNPPEKFDEYYVSKIESLRSKLDPYPASTINLSGRLFHGSCIDWMNAHPESVDHIVTDPPYGIDMAMLNQGNDGHAFKDIDTVEAEHTVSGNESLFVDLFPAAYNCLKPNGFFVLWCDIMQWQRLFDLATSAGFKVQRWPIVWVKTHRCMNQSAKVNFTKSVEFAMVCRKGTATLNEIAPECHILASHDDYKDQLGHPFVKPFEIWEFIIRHVSFEGQTILEPFGGRGSGVISIARCKRQFIACEKDDSHFNGLVENLKNYYWKINPNFKFE